MATASKRISRKQLRQPDWLHVTAQSALEIYEENRAKVLIAAAAAVLALIAIWGWQVFKGRQDVEAAQEFTKAISLYQSEKYRDAVLAFQKVAGYRWSSYSLLAHLYEANSYLAINDLDKAIAAAQRFLAESGSNSLFRQMGLLTLAAAEEKKSDCKQAAGHYSEAANINAPLRDRAMMGKGRCSEQIGDPKGAIAAYKEYQQSNPDSSLAVRLAELEAKIGGQATSK
jgi:hypothetical protein